MTDRWSGRPERVREWIATGDEPFPAGRIAAYLAARGIAAAVSVRGDGGVTIEPYDPEAHSGAALAAALAAFDPAIDGADPDRAKRAAAAAVLRTALSEIRAKAPLLRTAADRAVLALAALQGADDTPVEAAGR